MDLDSFLEKDVITYLENAVNFGVQDKEEGQGDVDSLLAAKEAETAQANAELSASSGGQAVPPIEVHVDNVIQEETPSEEATTDENSPEWFDELEKTSAERRAELDKIVDLEDSLNDIQYALDAHDIDKAKALYDHALQETNDIQYHPQEKIFLLGELKRFSEKLASEEQLVSEMTSEESTDDISEETSQETPDDDLTKEKDDDSTPAPDEQGDLPPSFLDEETQVMYSYVDGVQALRNNDKTKALEIFLQLAKQRPKNLAIKIRLQEAIELV